MIKIGTLRILLKLLSMLLITNHTRIEALKRYIKIKARDKATITI